MKLEERYIVIKKSDIKYALYHGSLIGSDIDTLNCTLEVLNLERHRRGKADLKTVVVESDWPEYELVWKMIASRVDHGDKQFEKVPDSCRMVANQICQAVIMDEAGEGCDLSAGLIGEKLTAVIMQIDQWRRRSEQFQMIVNLMGYVQNGTETTVKLFQDDATMDYHVTVGENESEWGRSLAEALAKANAQYGGNI